MSDTLRKQVIRLAADHPEYRGDLLPLLKVASQFKINDRVLVPNKFLAHKEQDFYEGVVERVDTAGGVSIRVPHPSGRESAHIPISTVKAREILPFTPGKTQVTYNPQLDELMDGWSKEVAHVLDGAVLSKKQERLAKPLWDCSRCRPASCPPRRRARMRCYTWSSGPALKAGLSFRTHDPATP